MYSNILVAVALDHPEAAGGALDVARRLRADGGVVTALHVVEDIPSYAMSYIPDEIMARRLPEAEAQMKAELGEVHDVRTVVVHGHAGRTIVEHAVEQGVDCIVIASHRPGLQDYFLGSTAQRVVRHAPCAVHVTR